MPIRYRDFIYKQLISHYEKKNKDAEKQQQQMNAIKSAKPNVKPTYTAKARPPQK